MSGPDPITDADIDEACEEWPEDVARLAEVLGLPPRVAAALWIIRSNAWSAGWLLLPKSDRQVISDVRKYAW